MLFHLCDSATVDHSLAVHPSVWTEILSPVLGGWVAAGVAVVYRRVKVPGFSTRAPTVMWRSVACEDARHHMKSKEDLRKTDQHVQDLLISPKAADLLQYLIKIHFWLSSNSFSSQIRTQTMRGEYFLSTNKTLAKAVSSEAETFYTTNTATNNQTWV